MSKILLNNEIGFNLDKLMESRLLVQANSGGGKSWAIRRLIEQSHGKVQHIIIDLEGEFLTLREKYDFLFAGKGGDVEISVKTAALLARKILELGVSTIIDLSDMHAHERKPFLRIFAESLLNVPKENHGDCMIIIDEAHQFAPEKGQSEAAGAVIDLCTRGRKRYLCTVLATQRISKLAKDAAAECNNKLIGRSAQDVDMKRAADELGFSTKEQLLSLRHLEPGEFYVFGPAISNEVQKLKIGTVETTHQRKRGVERKPIAPTAKIKEILGKLADLPQEAQKEAQTIAELKAEISTLKRDKIANSQQKIVENDPKMIEKALEPHLLAFATIENAYKVLVDRWESHLDDLRNFVNSFTLGMRDLDKSRPTKNPGVSYEIPKNHIFSPSVKKQLSDKISSEKVKIQIQIPSTEHLDSVKPLRAGAMKMLNWLAGSYPQLVTKQRLATLSGFTATGGTFNTYISELKRNGWIEGNSEFLITENGLKNANPETIPTGDELISLWKTKFRAGAGNILQFVYDNKSVSKEDIGSNLNFEITGGTFNTYISELRRNGLISVQGNIITIADEMN